MLKFIVYCDFASLKCNFQQFAEFLNGYSDNYENLNNDIWLIDIDDGTSPFYNDLSSIAKDLESIGYADKNSIIFAAQYSSLNYRFAGVDESIHVD